MQIRSVQTVEERTENIKRTKLAIFAVAAAVVVIDQLSKAWAVAALSDRSVAIAGSVVQLKLVRNPGSAFGLFSGSTLLVFGAGLVITAVVVVWAFRDPEAPAVLGLVLGGGIGNLIDRIVRQPGGGAGHVIDFLYLSFWPTFNLADSAIVVGVGWLFLAAFRAERPA